MQAHGAFAKAVEAAGAQILGGDALQPPSTAVQDHTRQERRQAAVFTDGPFGETKEIVSGYYKIEREGCAQATRARRALPHRRLDRALPGHGHGVDGVAASRTDCVATPALDETFRRGVAAHPRGRHPVHGQPRARRGRRAGGVRAGRGIPERELLINPAAWVTTVAKRIAIDTVRRDARLRSEAAAAGIEEPDPRPRRSPGGDDRLGLLFVTCTPDLATGDAARARAAVCLRCADRRRSPTRCCVQPHRDERAADPGQEADRARGHPVSPGRRR